MGEYQKGRTWATRKRPWVDRLVIGMAHPAGRIDKRPSFTLAGGRQALPLAGTPGYDFDGATFMHVGDQVIEVVMSFGSLQDPALRQLAALWCTGIDVGASRSMPRLGWRC